MKNFLKKIEKQARKFLSDSRGSHDFDHTMRVYNLAIHIGKIEKANLEILKLSALLHDIGRHEEDKSKGKISHEKAGAEMAEKLLEKYNFKEEKIKKILHCILAHRFRGKIIPKTLEAKVLFDADKLDSIGAVGIGRTFLFAGEIGAKLHNESDVDILKTKEYSKDDTGYREFMVKLRHVKDRMLTNEGRRIAKERHEFMIEFFERLKKEVEGEI